MLTTSRFSIFEYFESLVLRSEQQARLYLKYRGSTGIRGRELFEMETRVNYESRSNSTYHLPRIDVFYQLLRL